MAERESRLSWLVEAFADWTEIVLHVPFEVSIIGRKVQIVGEVHARRMVQDFVSQWKSSINFTVQRTNDFPF